MEPRTSQTPVWHVARLKRSCGTPRGLADPGKVKALRREGPKRGAKELFRIIETADNLVNSETVRKYPGFTVDKVPPRRKTLRKNFVPVSARENQAPMPGRPIRAAV